MKKIFAILTVCALCVSALGTTAFAQNSANQLPTDSWEVVVCGYEPGELPEGYENYPEPPNAEPNWNDGSDTASGSLPSDSWEFISCGYDEDELPEGYENYPEPPNAEPNWNDTAATASASLPSDSWEIDVECGELPEGYENYPEPPNAEPNWNDGSDTASGSLPSDSWEFISCGGELLENYENRPELPNAEPIWEDSTVVGRAASIRVDIQSPLEQSWINSHSNDYYYQANRVVERIDDYLYSKFGIDFYSVSHPHWSTTSSSDVGILSDVTNRFGTGNADLMIAFAGSLVSGTFGIAYVGHPYALVFDHAYTQNCKTAQHEVGHTYGLLHCSSLKNCVMKQGADLSWSLFEHLCPYHEKQWNDAKTNY